MEVITAIALLGTLMIAVWAASTNAVGSLGRISSRITTDLELMRINSTVRGYLDRIDTPYWEAGPKSERVPGGLRLYYFDGAADRYVEMRFADGRLMIDDGHRSESFGGINDASMRLLDATEHVAVGFEISVTFKEGERDTIRAPFGAYPFPLVAAS